MDWTVKTPEIATPKPVIHECGGVQWIAYPETPANGGAHHEVKINCSVLQDNGISASTRDEDDVPALARAMADIRAYGLRRIAEARAENDLRRSAPATMAVLAEIEAETRTCTTTSTQL
jgi:hypothetical protein